MFNLHLPSYLCHLTSSPMLPDITTRAHIENLFTQFYQQAFADPVIGYIFTDVTHLDLIKHMPVIANFWEDMLLTSHNYFGNPMKVHQQIDQLSRLTPEHFARWLQLWEQTIDANFKGETADMAKQRAHGIAKIMMAKIEMAR
ncbi:group III truncated hemoglobin [Mucilaginibacter sp. HMF5004]|uniref:group III truncated hemoglobin n=1 Tax=Mucilaginibacter rivuli TaxID=2857527 RepID=UPI001C5F3209|nr:group III truncated hemoglobin [Mucilaginibacter rivuli]MBW4891932.1 group III truncated hemoglobin [Mucilaginibacter rivuli]